MARANARLRTRRREDYPYMLEYRTRWSDNDMYHHMNNSVYNFLFDSIVNDFLINVARIDPATSPQHGVTVRSEITFLSSIAYPAVAEVGVRMTRLGNTSVAYETALFEKGVPGVKAVGTVVHVVVDRETGKTAKGGMAASVRAVLEPHYRGPVDEGKGNKESSKL